MKIVVIGDSIARGTFTAKDDNCPMSVAKNNFGKVLQKLLKADEYENLGINGSSFSDSSKQSPEFAICRRCDTVKGDIIIIFAGTNDFGTNVELGHYSDNNTNTFFGSLDYVFKTIKKNNPFSKIVVVTPMHRLREDKNERSLSLLEYKQAMELVAKKYTLLLCDAFDIKINPNSEKDKEKYILDGLHPNEKGHKIIANYLYHNYLEV